MIYFEFAGHKFIFYYFLIQATRWRPYQCKDKCARVLAIYYISHYQENQKKKTQKKYQGKFGKNALLNTSMKEEKTLPGLSSEKDELGGFEDKKGGS